MSETKGIVKCVLGFLLTIIVIVGGAFGLDVRVNVADTETTNADVAETTCVETENVETDFVDETTSEDVLTTDEVVEREQSPVDSTETEDEEPAVDESVGEEVTEPTDEQQNTVTEKGEN